MSSFQIIVGSMLGGTEYVAEACEEELLALGHQVTLHLQPKFDEILSDQQTWLICTSTHGAGEFPDNFQAFAKDLGSNDQKLSSTAFFTIGVGNTDYDTYCKAAIDIDNTLETTCYKRLLPIKMMDMSLDIDPEEIARSWILENKDHL